MPVFSKLLPYVIVASMGIANADLVHRLGSAHATAAATPAAANSNVDAAAALIKASGDSQGSVVTPSVGERKVEEIKVVETLENELATEKRDNETMRTELKGEVKNNAVLQENLATMRDRDAVDEATEKKLENEDNRLTMENKEMKNENDTLSKGFKDNSEELIKRSNDDIKLQAKEGKLVVENESEKLANQTLKDSLSSVTRHLDTDKAELLQTKERLTSAEEQKRDAQSNLEKADMKFVAAKNEARAREDAMNQLEQELKDNASTGPLDNIKNEYNDSPRLDLDESYGDDASSLNLKLQEYKQKLRAQDMSAFKNVNSDLNNKLNKLVDDDNTLMKDSGLENEDGQGGVDQATQPEENGEGESGEDESDGPIGDSVNNHNHSHSHGINFSVNNS